MAPRMSSASQIVTLLLLEVFNFVLLLISLKVLSTAKVYIEFQESTVRFNDIIAYRYMFVTNVIGLEYTFLQIALSIFHVIMRNHLISGDVGTLLDFYSDKAISYLLATGAAAGFGATENLKATFDAFGVDKSFDMKGYASASLLLLAFVCTAILSVISSYALPKKV